MNKLIFQGQRFILIIFGIIILIACSEQEELKNTLVVAANTKNKIGNDAVFFPTLQQDAPEQTVREEDVVSATEMLSIGYELNQMPRIEPEDQTNLIMGNPTTLKLLPWEIVSSMVWVDAGEYLVFSAGKYMFLCNIPCQNSLVKLDAGSYITSSVYDEESQRLIVGSRDGWIRSWKFEEIIKNHDSKSLPEPDWIVQAHKKGVNQIILSQSVNELMTAGNDGLVKNWVIESGEFLSELIGGSRAIPDIAVKPDESNIAIINGDVIRVRVIQSKQIDSTFRAPDNLLSIEYSPDGQYLLGGGFWNQIFVWNSDSGFRQGSIEYPEPKIFTELEENDLDEKKLIWDIDFHPNDKYFASATGDGSISIWHTDVYTPVVTVAGHDKAVTCLKFNPDGTIMASGSLDGVVKLWPFYFNFQP